MAGTWGRGKQSSMRRGPEVSGSGGPRLFPAVLSLGTLPSGGVTSVQFWADSPLATAFEGRAGRGAGESVSFCSL